MYQPYPSGGRQPVPPLSGPPQRVRTAVMLMYAGAALSAIEIIVGLNTISSFLSAVWAQYPSYSSSQIHAAEVLGLALAVLVGLIAVGLWLWMAWANGAGRNWARIVASVLTCRSLVPADGSERARRRASPVLTRRAQGSRTWP